MTVEEVTFVEDNIFGSFGKQLGINKLEGLGGEVGIKDIQSDINIENNGERVTFFYKGLLLGFIDYVIDDGSVSLEFIGNINMNAKDEEIYGVNYHGLRSLQDEEIRIEGLGEYMVNRFLEDIQGIGNIGMLTAEIDNPRIIEIFTRLKIEGIIKSLKEEVSEDDNGFLRKFIDVELP